MAERCQAVAKNGKPCGATVVADGMCAWHAPSWEAKRRQWSAKGGAARSNKNRVRKQLPANVMSTVELRGLLGTVLKAVVAGRLEPGIGNASANLARALNELAKTSELEERLTALEAAAGIGRTG